MVGIFRADVYGRSCSCTTVLSATNNSPISAAEVENKSKGQTRANNRTWRYCSQILDNSSELPHWFSATDDWHDNMAIPICRKVNNFAEYSSYHLIRYDISHHEAFGAHPSKTHSRYRSNYRQASQIFKNYQTTDAIQPVHLFMKYRPFLAFLVQESTFEGLVCRI